MGIKDKICPTCGALSSEKEFVGFFCIDCFAERENIKVPKKIVIHECKECKRLKITKWKGSIRELEEDIASLCKGKYDKIDVNFGEDLKDCIIIMHFGKGKRKIILPVEIKRTLCQECSRKIRGYYEAIIQLRYKDKKDKIEKEKTKSLAEKIIKEIEKKTFIALIKKFDYGIDIYIGSTPATYHVLKNLELKYRTSRKLWGEKKGKRLYRITFLII